MEARESNNVPTCFARKGSVCKIKSGFAICVFMKKKKNHENATCRFCKPERDVTNGVRYPWIDPEEKE